MGDFLKAKMPATATHDSHYCACPDHLGPNRNDPISVAPPKVGKASTVVSVALVSSLSCISIGDFLKAKMPARATHDSHYCACPDHLGPNRNDPICVAPPKVGKASECRVSLSSAFLHTNFANVQERLFDQEPML